MKPLALPIVIAEKYGFDLQSKVVNFIEYYAVQDWVAGVAQTNNPRTFWNNLKTRMNAELSTGWGQLKVMGYAASNGKTYQMDYTDAKGLYVITQRMGVNTGLRNDILDYLAKAGVVLDEIRVDPAKALAFVPHDDEWIQARLESKVARKELTAALEACVKDPDYAFATKITYSNLFQRTVEALRDELGLSPNQSIRDHLTTNGLLYLRIAESVVTQELRASKEMLTDKEAYWIIRRFVSLVGKQARELSELTGRDTFTGRLLIGEGTWSTNH